MSSRRLSDSGSRPPKSAVGPAPRSLGQMLRKRVTRNPRTKIHWFCGRFYMQGIGPIVRQHRLKAQDRAKPTSPLGPSFKPLPLTFRSSKWTPELFLDTRTPNDISEPPRLSEKAALIHDLARWHPVTRMISSIRSTP